MSHHHSREHEHEPDPATIFSQEFWDERYRSTGQVWSGNPNARLVEHAADLAPGNALDVGRGEGADAIWLAARGWRVTAIDISTVVLERAAGFAAQAGRDIAARIDWQQADVLTWEPAPAQYDLVSAHFVHLPGSERPALFRRMAAAVRSGGTLLIVAHHPSDLETTIRRWHLPDLFFTAEEIAAALDPDGWRIVVADAPERQATDSEGRPVTIRDTVLRAERRSTGS